MAQPLVCLGLALGLGNLAACSLVLDPDDLEFETTANLEATLLEPACVGIYTIRQGLKGCFRTCQSAKVALLGGTGNIESVRWDLSIADLELDPGSSTAPGAAQHYGLVVLEPGISTERELTVDVRADYCGDGLLLALAKSLSDGKKIEWGSLGNEFSQLVGSGQLKTTGLAEGVAATIDGELEVHLRVNGEINSKKQLRIVKLILYDSADGCTEHAPTCYTGEAVSSGDASDDASGSD